MNDVNEVSGPKELYEWLKGKPRSWVAWIALRAVLRILPFGWVWYRSDAVMEYQLSELPLVRLALLSWLTVARPSSANLERLREANYKSGGDVNAIYDLARAFRNSRVSAKRARSTARTFRAVRDASDSIVQACDPASRYVGYFPDDVVNAISDLDGPDLATQFWNTVRSDCRHLAQAEDVAVSEPNVLPLGELDDTWQRFREEIKSSGVSRNESKDSFWFEWYDAVVEGRPLDLDMLEEIAQILTDIRKSDKVPSVPGPLIALIKEKHRIRAELAALEAKTAEAIGEIEALPPRGHNQPPELIEEADDALEDLRELQLAVQNARKEVESPAPDTTRLADAGRVIARVGLALANYCGGKADIVVTEAAKKIGAGLGIAIVTITVVAATSGTLGPAIQEFAARWTAAQKQALPPTQAPGPGVTPAP